MRYIGSKDRLLDKINQLINEKCADSFGGVFCDIFSGTGCVGQSVKDRFSMITNDFLFFSYLLNVANVKLNHTPTFSKLKKEGIEDVFSYLEEAPLPKTVSNNYFFTNAYSPAGDERRMYLTITNSRRIDFIRSQLDDWHQKGLLNNNEFEYLVACLISSVPSYSNITGTYGAYLKFWDNRCLKTFQMERIVTKDNKRHNLSYNEDSNELIKKIHGDVLYVDPPYNSRQYLSNYHLLETIAKNDFPTLIGITGTRHDEHSKSNYCNSKQCLLAFDSLIRDAQFRHIIVSYNSEGILTKEEILTILEKYCIPESVFVQEHQFGRYQNKKTRQSNVVEYLFYGQKNKNVEHTEPISKSKPITNTSKYIKSPMNYVGGKYRILPQIIPLFPKNITTFVDLFAGGFSVSANVTATQTISNDVNFKVVEMVNRIVNDPLEKTIKQIHWAIASFSLSKDNKEGFFAFRNYYNKTQNPIDLFTLSCFSFNYQFRFNDNGEYNNPFGKNRSSYSETTEKKLISFSNTMKNKDLVLLSKDFRSLDFSKLDKSSFVYCDPPYLLTTGSYNDGKRFFGDWLEKDEVDLLNLLDQLNSRCIRFALSEVMKRNDKTNSVLLEWSKKYKVHYINSDYSNCNYHIREKRNVTEEVLITNY